MSHLQSRWLAATLLFAGLCCNLFAVDGIILIDQNRALAGGVTPGDAPGFPVTISLPGSYRLSGNLTVPDANTTAIVISVNNVTLDLNGFSILGPTVCSGEPVASCSPTGTGTGVKGASNIRVFNGIVHGVGNIGVRLTADSSVDKVTATENGGTGIQLDFEGVVTGSTASRNGGSGIDVMRGVITGNLAQYNSFAGIRVLDGSLVSGNTTVANRVYGILANCPSNFVGNTALSNSVANLSTTGAGCGNFNNVAP